MKVCTELYNMLLALGLFDEKFSSLENLYMATDGREDFMDFEGVRKRWNRYGDQVSEALEALEKVDS